MTTTRQEIAARRKPPAGVASLKADKRTAFLSSICRAQIGNEDWMIHSKLRRALEAAFEAGRAYPRRHAKGRAR